MEENGTSVATADAGSVAADNDNLSAGQQQPATVETPAVAEYNFEELYDRYEKGEDVGEHFERFQTELIDRQENGRPLKSSEAQPETSQTANDNGSQKTAEWQTKLMAEVGAKTPDELLDKVSGLRAQISQNGNKYAEERKTLEKQYSEVLAKLAAGDPKTLEEFKNTFGKDFQTQPVALVAQANAEVNPSDWSPSMFLDEEVGGKFLNYVSGLEKTIKGYEDKFKNYDSMLADFDAHKQRLQQAEQKEKRARFQTSLIDEIKELAEKNAEFYNLKGDIPIRDLISKHILATDNSELPEGYKPSQAIEDLFETVRVSADKSLSLADAHKLRFYDKINSDVKLAANKPQQTTSFRPVGVMGATNGNNGRVMSSSVNLTDEQMNAMLQGKIDMPEEWFEDGIPVENKIPSKIYKTLMGQTT